MRDRLRLAGALCCTLGLGIAAYLTYVHYAGISPLCEIAHGCERVQSSPWSELAGIPVALLGLLGYAVMLVALFVPGENALLAAAGTAVVGWGFSMYLTYREVFTIHAICSWCVASAALMTALSVITVMRLLRAPAASDGPVRRPSIPRPAAR